MADSHTLGKKGEDLAVDHLGKNGYKILRRNWKAGKLEVDIIAENKDYFVFVEVKTRSEDYLVSPVTAVNREKQRTIILCADAFVKWNNVSKEIRFDVITVTAMSDDTFKVEHIENAFYPTLR
jgi:putative endonuclease